MGNRITKNAVLKKVFGLTEERIVDLPHSLSGTRVFRIFAVSRGECGYCFPHGWEAPNSRWKKDLRSWKRYRNTQYRQTEIG